MHCFMLLTGNRIIQLIETSGWITRHCEFVLSVCTSEWRALCGCGLPAQLWDAGDMNTTERWIMRSLPVLKQEPTLSKHLNFSTNPNCNFTTRQTMNHIHNGTETHDHLLIVTNTKLTVFSFQYSLSHPNLKSSNTYWIICPMDKT